MLCLHLTSFEHSFGAWFSDICTNGRIHATGLGIYFYMGHEWVCLLPGTCCSKKIKHGRGDKCTFSETCRNKHNCCLGSPRSYSETLDLRKSILQPIKKAAVKTDFIYVAEVITWTVCLVLRSKAKVTSGVRAFAVSNKQRLVDGSVKLTSQANYTGTYWLKLSIVSLHWLATSEYLFKLSTTSSFEFWIWCVAG